MKILVLNCGSSSIKYQVFDMTDRSVMAKGLVDKIGIPGSLISHKVESKNVKEKIEKEIPDHTHAIQDVLQLIVHPEFGCLSSLSEINAVGHRVVHGEEVFCSSVLITGEVIAKMEECSDLAPLHNPQNLKGIYAIRHLMPNVPQVGVFDTAFHQTMPAYSYMYAIPYSLYAQYKIRRYGFHGTSHRFISERVCEILNLDYHNSKIITCHLGNGASIAAILNGKSIDTSMGLTPVEGLMMGTRTGDLDVGALLHIMNKQELSVSETNSLINKSSGLLGISGLSSDMRDLELAAWDKKDEKAQLALDMYYYRVRKYIGAYAAAMGGVDAIVFAGGVGENGWELREIVCDKNFEYLGVDFDVEKNHGLRGKEAVITKEGSKVKVVVVPTDEELVIAQDTYKIINDMNK